jgi:hypothetical protein
VGWIYITECSGTGCIRLLPIFRILGEIKHPMLMPVYQFVALVWVFFFLEINDYLEVPCVSRLDAPRARVPGHVHTPVGLYTAPLGLQFAPRSPTLLPGATRGPVSVHYHVEVQQEAWWRRDFV